MKSDCSLGIPLPVAEFQLQGLSSRGQPCRVYHRIRIDTEDRIISTGIFALFSIQCQMFCFWNQNVLF